MAEVKVEDANEAMNSLFITLHGKPGHTPPGDIKVGEIIKAGSLGHGTAVSGQYDLDMVVYSPSIDENDIVMNGYERWLGTVRGYLRRTLNGRMKNERITSRSLQFKLDDYIDVDILLSPLWREPRLLYNFLQQIKLEDRSMFSASASKWQVKFFSGQPNQVKELIKRAKAWRNKIWEGEYSGKPKSYLISVLVLKSYETAKQMLMGDVSFPRLPIRVTEVMKDIVCHHDTADIYWEEFYIKYDYRDIFPPSLPRIVDPANPSNNLYKTGIAGPNNHSARDYQDGDGNWAPFVNNIHTLDLSKTVEYFKM